MADRKILSEGPDAMGWSKDMTSYLKCVFYAGLFKVQPCLKIQLWLLIACVLPYHLLMEKRSTFCYFGNINKLNLAFNGPEILKVVFSPLSAFIR